MGKKNANIFQSLGGHIIENTFNQRGPIAYYTRVSIWHTITKCNYTLRNRCDTITGWHLFNNGKHGYHETDLENMHDVVQCKFNILCAWGQQHNEVRQINVSHCVYLCPLFYIVCNLTLNFKRPFYKVTNYIFFNISVWQLPQFNILWVNFKVMRIK